MRQIISDCATKLPNGVAGRSWLAEGRGSFAWDDDQYQEEFLGMISEFLEALDPLRVLAADWSDCPKDFQAARIDWKARAEKAETERDAALAENARLREAIVSLNNIARHEFSGAVEAASDKLFSAVGAAARAALASKETP